ncbi:MAG: hypothetical protein ACRCZF_26970 [Gemmataceae bacterium]
MKTVTAKQLKEEHGGKLPPGTVLGRENNPETPPPVAPPPSKPRRRSERFNMLNTFVDVGIANLTGAETKVWLILFRDTKANGTARTGQTDLARRAGLSVQGTKLALRKLRAKGFVKVVVRGQLNKGPSVYRISC